MSLVRITALLLAVVTALVYAPSLGFDFVDYDDDVYVVDNHDVRAGLTADGIRWAFTTGRASNWHPLTWISHMADVEIHGLEPAGHRATNVVLHVFNAMLLFALLSSATRRPWASLAVAALFALHPINVESVVWIAQRKSLLSTLFALAATWVYVAWTRRGGPWRYALTAVLLALGLMAKPMLVTLPLLFLLLDYWPLRRVGPPAGGDASRPTLSRLVIEKVPFLILCGISSLVTLLAQSRGGAVGSIERLGVLPRLANACVSYVGYLRRMVWPGDLAITYQHPYLAGGESLEAWRVLAAAALLAGITVAAIRLRRRPWLCVGWSWFLVSLIPVIGLVQVGAQSMADRYAYIPLIGPFVIVVWGGGLLLERITGGEKTRHALAAALGLVVLAAAAYGTWRQTRFWRDSEALFERALTVSPRSPTLHFNLGTVLEKNGRPGDAVEHYRQALAASPGAADAHYGLGNALYALDRPEEAIREYRISLDLEPGRAEAQFNLANTLRSLDFTDEAIGHYRMALEIDGTYAAARNNLGTALLEQGSLAAAEEQFELGIEADPRLADLRNNLGVVLVRSGRWAEALSRFREAASLAPDWPAPLVSVARILAGGADPSLRDPEEAVRLARRAVELEGATNPDSLDVFAAALAADRRFDEAVIAAETAADLASRAGRETLAVQIRRRLDLYRRGIPLSPGN